LVTNNVRDSSPDFNLTACLPKGLPTTANLANLFWLFFMLSAIQPFLQQRLLEAARARRIARFERERGSRVMRWFIGRRPCDCSDSRSRLYRHQRFRGHSARHPHDR
jgi:hypothetical protein